MLLIGSLGAMWAWWAKQFHEPKCRSGHVCRVLAWTRQRLWRDTVGVFYSSSWQSSVNVCKHNQKPYIYDNVYKWDDSIHWYISFSKRNNNQYQLRICDRAITTMRLLWGNQNCKSIISINSYTITNTTNLFISEDSLLLLLCFKGISTFVGYLINTEARIVEQLWYNFTNIWEISGLITFLRVLVRKWT